MIPTPSSDSIKRIDPFATVDNGASIDAWELSPSPVEIKAVREEPPYGLRLTTNEYQQCLNFITTAGRDYVLRLVYVPDSENRIANADMRKDVVLESESDLREIISRREFERNVRQGTISVNIGE